MTHKECKTCSGFGMKIIKTIHYPDFTVNEKAVSISINEARMIVNPALEFDLEWLECPECHSTPYGIPETERNKS